MMRLLVLPCDGIGPEIVAASLRVLEAPDRRFGLALALEHAMSCSGSAQAVAEPETLA